MEAYETIRDRYGGEDEPPRFLIHRDGLVLALCLQSDRNPRIFSDPAEVWVEENPCYAAWTEVLAEDTGAVPLYLSQWETAAFRRRGVYHVIGSTDSPLDLARRMAFPGIPRLAKIIFLSGPHEPILEPAD